MSSSNDIEGNDDEVDIEEEGTWADIIGVELDDWEPAITACTLGDEGTTGAYDTDRGSSMLTSLPILLC
jgi:hypothetical protein